MLKIKYPNLKSKVLFSARMTKSRKKKSMALDGNFSEQLLVTLFKQKFH